MKRKNWFRKSRKQGKPPEKKAAEYSVDEILTEFRSEYPEPEDETMEEDLPADEPEEEREAPQEEKTEDAAEPEEAPLYSVRDILRDYRLMTMESRYAEVERKREDRAEDSLPGPAAASEEPELPPAQERESAQEAKPVQEPEPVQKPEEKTAGREETFSIRDILREYRFRRAVEEKTEKSERISPAGESAKMSEPSDEPPEKSEKREKAANLTVKDTELRGTPGDDNSGTDADDDSETAAADPRETAAEADFHGAGRGIAKFGREDSVSAESGRKDPVRTEPGQTSRGGAGDADTDSRAADDDASAPGEAEPVRVEAAGKANDEYAFHDIMNEFLQMPDEGEHAPVQQKMPEARTAVEEKKTDAQTGRGEAPTAGRWFSSGRRDRRRQDASEKNEKPQADADRLPAGKAREVKEEFPENPKPGDGEPFVDNLDYAAIFKMFADPEEAKRFEEVKPEPADDHGMNEVLDRAAMPVAVKETPAEEKKPLFAEQSPDFRDILREFMMGDQHPIYADMPGIGKKADELSETPPERKEAPAPRRRREYAAAEDFPASPAAGEDETPAPRRRREYTVEESFPESSAEGAAEPSDGTEQPAESAAGTAEDGERPEKAAKLDRVRNFLNGLNVRRTEGGKKALNSPRAFARYEDYLPDEETALKDAEAAERAKRTEAEEEAETPAEGDSGEAKDQPERAGAHLGSTEERTEEEQTAEEKTEDEQAEEDDALLYAGDFPSFGQWILNELMGFWIKLNGVGDRQSTATMQDDREELGGEVNVANASRYYGSQVTMLRMRVQIGLAVLAILAYITLGFPVSGMLKTAKVAAGMCLALQLTVMLLCLDVVTNAAINLTRGRFGADALAVLACLISCFDALAAATGAFGTPHIPLCLFSSLALMGILFADLLSARALRKSLRVPAIGKRAYCVTAEEGVRGGREITLLKSIRPLTGFVRRAEETPPDEMLFSKAAVFEFLAALVLSLLIGLVKHSMKDMLYILSAMLSCTVPVTALLAFALPFFIGAQRIFSSGAAVAGWSGIHDIGCSRNLIVTDRDLFPEETIAIETVRVFADESAERVISYAGTMIAASGSGLGPCFADLMEKNSCRMRKVEDFKWLSGGGLQGLIEGHLVLCGGADLMQLMNVKVPYRLVDQTTVLLSIDGVLYGIFKINYTGLPEIRAALQELIASNRHPIFAIRDFIITPEMLHGVFDVATDGYDFPPYGDRFRISEAKPSELSQVSAVVCREGLGPLTHLADTGRSMYVAIRMNLIITALTAVAGTLLVFFRLIGPGVLNAWLPFVLMLLDAIFVMLISLFMRF